jgi:hypothetical protein
MSRQFRQLWKSVYEIDYELDGEDYEAVYDNNGQLISVELESW